MSATQKLRRLLTSDENCLIMDMNKNTVVPGSEYVYVRVCVYIQVRSCVLPVSFSEYGYLTQ